ncbi:3-(3-hydroxyphenyl)propionate hydroxylase [Amycolatopsis sp. K13G38]|uniref:3-(3-hydroxyphenyl)propionate hydroxylase n=1 Tax=Amycolatopsis acididurans TaxID=2724524 RepID=A0ABX1JH25_9PSEU|nr:FAD-dependent monooxygenase [Amycolatopsis acididurans]NKQ57856.1 3-(3-hydroxyphenyl)propionate hydroxylase [Amycolatopsis acididurans]
MRVLIGGAGPTGLTLGIDLARRGVDVRVVDKATEYFAGSRGDGLQPRTLEVFDDLGVLDAVLAAGAPPAPVHVYLDGKFAMERRISEPREASPDVPYPNPHMLGQSQTEGILRDRLAEFGVRVEPASGLTGFTQDADGVTATLATGEVVRADYLVGADGGASFVRKTLGIEFEGTTDESIRMCLGDVAAELDAGHAYRFAKETDPMTGVVLSPLPGTDLFQFALPRSDAEPSLDSLRDALAAVGADVRLTRLAWSTIWRPNVRLAKRFRDGRVFLAGDAAHVHPPTGGQGLNTGVQDAYNLGWKLADGSPELLDSYETERRGVAAAVLGLSTGLLRKYTDGDQDAFKRGEEFHQLNITYRTTDGFLVPGDRAPDAPVIDESGKEMRLFDLFRGPHATRLVFGEPAPAEPHAYAVLRPGRSAPGPYVTDAAGHAFTAYGASDGDEFAIRPDGYVA